MVRNQYPTRDIIINVDKNALDSQGNLRPADKNTGLIAATEVAKLINRLELTQKVFQNIPNLI
jgi:hypothetical protein